jgi:hypothetical protein
MVCGVICGDSRFLSDVGVYLPNFSAKECTHNSINIPVRMDRNAEVILIILIAKYFFYHVMNDIELCPT